ncbi:MAG: glycosyltransferase family 4 protein [Candidatus Riflebacteria bacterium]
MQELIPHYRVSFFSQLSKYQHDITVFHSTCRRTDGLVISCQFSFSNTAVTILKIGRLYWQNILTKITTGKFRYVVIGLELKIISNYFVWLSALFSPYKVIWWTHGFNVQLQRNDFKFWLDRIIKTVMMKLSSRILLYTDYNLDELLRWGISRDKIIILNNAIDERPYQEALEKVSRADIERVEQQTSKSGHTITFLGRLTRGKKVERVLEIAKILLPKFPDLRVLIIGDGEERASLELGVRESGLEGTVFFLGTITDPQELSPYMKVTDFVVLPGSVGLTIVHSMIYGIPFVTLENEKHSPEIAYLINDYNGYKAQDLQGMCRWISEVFDDPEKKNRLKDNCLTTIREKVSLTHMAEQFVKAFE